MVKSKTGFRNTTQMEPEDVPSIFYKLKCSQLQSEETKYITKNSAKFKRLVNFYFIFLFIHQLKLN